MKFLLLLLSFCCVNVLGQTVSVPIGIAGITYSAVVQLETISASTGNPVLTGSATKITTTINPLTDSVILADILGNKTTATSISGLRATFTASGAIGWNQTGTWAVRVSWTPFTLPAGGFVGCRYDMPAMVFDTVKLIFLDPKPGVVNCSVGVKSASLPAPGTVVGVITPPPTTTASKPGDQSPPLAQLVATDGAVWTLVAGRPLRNGVDVGTGGYTVAFLYVSSVSTIRFQATTGVYQCWTGTAWAGAGC